MIDHSRISGFYRKSIEERRKLVASRTGETLQSFSALMDGGGIAPDDADKFVENVVGVYALPFCLQLNVQLNSEPRLVPMVVEEPSVVAAASNAAKMVANSGGFHARVAESLMIGQIELDLVADPEHARSAIEAEQAALLACANQAVPGLVARGGGATGLTLRDLGEGHMVVHVLVDCQDAMGANLVNTVAEALGPKLASLTQGRLGLRILSNLCDRRKVVVTCQVDETDLAKANTGSNQDMSGADVADAIVRASRFAERDPYRAATHNKGIMNGVDSVVIASGNDFRAVEAGAHSYAARSGRYLPLATWQRSDAGVTGRLEMPLALGTVGGTLRVHPTARMALRLANVTSANDLAMLAATAGLASNLAALRALSSEGIQRGHMSLHARAVASAAGATKEEVNSVASQIAEQGTVTLAAAQAVLKGLRSR